MKFKKLAAIGLASALLFSAGVVIGAQPHMQNALEALHNANNQLEKASHNKGGHRERAMELVNQAISEVQAGMAYAGN
jgi:hypothetical protein